MRTVWLRAGREAACAPGRLVVDLSGIMFFSVAGVALLIDAEQQCREQALELRLMATTHSVLRTLASHRAGRAVRHHPPPWSPRPDPT